MSGHRWPHVFGFIVAVASGPALAQDFTQGKTPAQLFAGDCAACHKSPQGLAKGGDPRAIASFLREHYTTKPEMAEALAAYVISAGGNGRGQPAAADRGDSTGSKPGRASASADGGRGTDTRPRGAIPGSDETKPPDVGDNVRPAAKPRGGPIAGDSAKPGDSDRQPGKLRASAAVGDVPKPADDRDASRSQGRAAVDARHGGEDDGTSEPPRSKPRAVTRGDDAKKPADAQIPTGKLSAYARAGSSDKETVTESAEERESKLRSYATSGDAAPTPMPVSVSPTAAASPPTETPATGQDPSSDGAKAASPEAPKPATDETLKSEPNEQSSPSSDEAPKAIKPRKSAASDSGKPQDGVAARSPRRTDAANATAPSSPMSFFGRIFSGGAKPRDADPAD